jgi:hypothetical protein
MKSPASKTFISRRQAKGIIYSLWLFQLYTQPLLISNMFLVSGHNQQQQQQQQLKSKSLKSARLVIHVQLLFQHSLILILIDFD